MIYYYVFLQQIIRYGYIFEDLYTYKLNNLKIRTHNVLAFILKILEQATITSKKQFIEVFYSDL